MPGPDRDVSDQENPEWRPSSGALNLPRCSQARIAFPPHRQAPTPRPTSSMNPVCIGVTARVPATGARAEEIPHAGS